MLTVDIPKEVSSLNIWRALRSGTRYVVLVFFLYKYRCTKISPISSADLGRKWYTYFSRLFNIAPFVVWFRLAVMAFSGMLAIILVVDKIAIDLYMCTSAVFA